MGVYTSSDGTEKDTASMNSFNLVNGLIKASKQYGFEGHNQNPDPISESNIQSLRDELLARLDTRPKEVEANHQLVVPIGEDELQDLQNGSQFNWVLMTSEGVSVHVLVRPETDEDRGA